MKKDTKTNLLMYAIICVALTGAILSSGCLSEPMSKVGDIFSPSSGNLFQKDDHYILDTADLTIPVVTTDQIDKYEDMPDELSDRSPGFELSSYYKYMQFYEGSESVVSVNVKNTGDNSVFVYQFGLKLTSENELIAQDTGVTIEPGEEKNIGIIALDVPKNVEEIELELQLSMLAQTKTDRWHDYKEQYFEEITIDVSEAQAMQEPEYTSNPENLFTQINEMIDPSDVGVRTMAAASAKKYPGQYNIYQICALFDDTKEEIQYISDPRGKDLWCAPGDTITVGAGDCDDYAILLSSLIEAIGGTSRVYLTDTHAFTAVYIGNETEEIANAIGEYYGPVPIYYTTDQYGSWLMLDPTSSIYAGGLPGGTAPTDEGWTFLDTTTVTVIDIAPKE
ncbi:transglutaminase family protein [Methanolobus sp. WCC4]|uniref:transglutaminase family protein n=1 Tax=Methanolobus sp. WCC4 TaxID=3125784 RepID=UPI0030F5BC79